VFEATINEFPFVEVLPRREKSKVRKVWDLVRQMAEIQKTEGTLVPLMLAGRCLDLSRSRIDDIVNDGRLKRVEIDGHVFITENSLIDFAQTERKYGRPCKLPQTSSEMMKIAQKTSREIIQKLR
jgi:hypothetical protein